MSPRNFFATRKALRQYAQLEKDMGRTGKHGSKWR